MLGFGPRGRLALAGLVLLGVLAVVVFGSVAWYYSDRINSGAFVLDDGVNDLDISVTLVQGGTVTLASAGATKDASWQRDGIFGLEWAGGYAQVGRITGRDLDTVRRELVPVRGALAAGQRARIDNSTFAHDPNAVGLPFHEVSIPTPGGPAAAWHVPGETNTWCIFVHGKGADRRQALRILPALRQSGATALVISYRNDVGAPAGPKQRYDYGETEWEDLAAAVDFARGAGAQRLVLVGYSMGGSIIMSLMEKPDYASMVSGLILDAPMLDLRNTAELRAKQLGLPQPVTNTAAWLAAKRFDIDWDAIAYLKRADRLTAPTLIIHGQDDKTVPIDTSEMLAEHRRDIVTFKRFPGAHHVESWNVDPDAYMAAVRDFLATIIAR
jgi:uncharacterized protein